MILFLASWCLELGKNILSNKAFSEFVTLNVAHQCKGYKELEIYSNVKQGVLYCNAWEKIKYMYFIALELCLQIGKITYMHIYMLQPICEISLFTKWLKILAFS